MNRSIAIDELRFPLGDWILFSFSGAMILCLISLALVWVKQGRLARTGLILATASLLPGILQVMMCMLVYDADYPAAEGGGLLSGPVWKAFILPVAPLVFAIQLIWFWGRGPRTGSSGKHR